MIQLLTNKHEIYVNLHGVKIQPELYVMLCESEFVKGLDGEQAQSVYYRIKSFLNGFETRTDDEKTISRTWQEG